MREKLYLRSQMNKVGLKIFVMSMNEYLLQPIRNAKELFYENR